MEETTREEAKELGGDLTEKNVPLVNEKEFSVPPSKEHKQIITHKYSGRVFKCVICGEEKCKETRSGSRPKYCSDCIKDIRRANIKKARLTKYAGELYKGTASVGLPDGSVMKVRSDDEKKFIENRWKQYLDDFELKKSSDAGLLTKLLLLELQTNRISLNLTLKYKATDAHALANLTEEIRKCQNGLAIDRAKRIDKKKVQDAHVIVQNMIEKFNNYRKEHPDRFMWKCSHCGKINHLKMENKTEEKDVKKD